MRNLIIFMLCLSGTLLTAQVPASVQAFKKQQDKVAAPSINWGDCSERMRGLLDLSVGYFDTGEQPDDSPLFRHVYRAVPIWEKAVEGKYWFYEEIALGVDANRPFSQRVFSYEEDEQGRIFRHYYYSEALEAFPNAWKNIEELRRNVKVTALPMLSGCASEVEEVGADFVYLGQADRSCQDPMTGDEGYVRYEYYLFEGGLATRPLAYDRSGRLVWGEPEVWYLAKRTGRTLE